MNEREGFILALKENPFDIATRRIFADWLDEHDEPELAEFHRNWSKETYEEAKAWMTNFAERVAENGKIERTYNELLEAGREYRADPEYRAYIGGRGETAQMEFYDSQTRQEFWEAWSILMNCPNTENDDYNFFRCAC